MTMKEGGDFLPPWQPYRNHAGHYPLLKAGHDDRRCWRCLEGRLAYERSVAEGLRVDVKIYREGWEAGRRSVERMKAACAEAEAFLKRLGMVRVKP